MIPAAELRLYQPLEDFDAEERARWERYILVGAPRPVRARFADLPTASGLGFVVPAGEEGAHVKLIDGVYFVCPERTRLRVLSGLLAVREAPPFEGAEEFVPDGQARAARTQLRRMRRRTPGQVATIVQSPWHVPVRWFVLFGDDERRLVDVDGRARLSYLTTTRRAARRVEETVPVLRHTELGPIADLLVELHQWLSSFGPTSLLELDYGGLCDLMTWDELDDDHSARDIDEALKALRAQEYVRSADLYQSTLSRSVELRNRESSN